MVQRPVAARWILAAFSLVLAGCGQPAAAPAAAPGAPVAAGPTTAEGSLAWAVGGDWRLPSERARDAWRHPLETLAFFGVKPGDTVVELWPGGGWYTAILGPYLREGHGKLVAAMMEPVSPEVQKQIDNYRAAFASKPETYGTIELTTASKTAPEIAPAGSADVVLTFRNIHNWMSDGYADKILADAFRALKPGGVLGVEEHRLPSRAEQDPTAGDGYVKEAYVIQLAEAAGFKLEARSEINANPKDKADHPVWMLPPTLRTPAPGSGLAKSYDPEAYKAIGESDRMTLKFRKPAATPAPAATPTP
jgi:predicted methyltransferase